MSRSFVFHLPYPIAAAPEVADIPRELVRDPAKIYRARPEAIEALRRMCRAAEQDGVGIVVISAHRARAEQVRLFEDGERRHGRGRAILWLAPPGYSEHHTGYVFDLADRDRPETDDEPPFEGTPAFAWLHAHARGHGFELSFPKDNWQGIGYEPWHWRFVGDARASDCFHPGPLRNASRLVRCVANGLYYRLR